MYNIYLCCLLAHEFQKVLGIVAHFEKLNMSEYCLHFLTLCKSCVFMCMMIILSDFSRRFFLLYANFKPSPEEKYKNLPVFPCKVLGRTINAFISFISFDITLRITY